MRSFTFLPALLLATVPAWAQQAGPAEFSAALPLGITVDGQHMPISANAKVFGSVVSAESCVYDATRDLVMVVNRGGMQTEAPNDGFVTLLNRDGSVHTLSWIGANRTGLVLNQPFGSDIHDGRLYVADSDGGTADGAPRVAVLRTFDIATGRPLGSTTYAQSAWFNDIAVAQDGTVYASQTGTADGQTPGRLFRIPPDGEATILVDGAPLARPNGVAIDPDGNVVVGNMDDHSILTFSPDGELLKTERSAQTGSDGLVILPDGQKLISSVLQGGITRLRPGQEPELIATNLPNAASMCYDPVERQLFIPLNINNAIAIVKVP